MNVMGIVFANIYESNLGDLTNKRTLASLPFGGRYRQIDFTLSNMSNSGIRHIGIITKHNYQSLMYHIGSGQEWDLEMEEGGLEYLTPFSMGSGRGYQGKLEALNSAMEFLEHAHEDYVVLADSAVVANMDLAAVVDAHVASGKDLTIVVKDGVANGTKQLDLAAKVVDGEVVDLAVNYAAEPGYLASTGIFVISREKLIHFVKESVARSLYSIERDFILKQFTEKRLTVGTYEFEGVTMFLESTTEYYRNNLALLDREVRHGLFNIGRTVYTKVRDRVPTSYGAESDVNDCLAADGCELNGTVEHSVLFRQVKVCKGACVADSVIMNDCVIGAGAKVRYAILDKDVVVSEGAELIGSPENPIHIKRGNKV